MSPDSSSLMPSKSMVIGASGTSGGGGENDLVMESVNKTVPFQSLIRVQVQECSQSQQSSSTGNIYFVKNDYVQQQKPIEHNGGAIIVAPTPSAALQHRNVEHRQVGKTVTAIHMPVVVSTHPPPPSSSPIYQGPSHQQQNQPEQHHQDHQPRRPETPEYTKAFPVMDTTVASSVKGEPDLNIGRLRFSVVC